MKVYGSTGPRRDPCPFPICARARLNLWVGVGVPHICACANLYVRERVWEPDYMHPVTQTLLVSCFVAKWDHPYSDTSFWLHLNLFCVVLRCFDPKRHPRACARVVCVRVKFVGGWLVQKLDSAVDYHGLDCGLNNGLAPYSYGYQLTCTRAAPPAFRERRTDSNSIYHGE